MAEGPCAARRIASNLLLARLALARNNERQPTCLLTYPTCVACLWKLALRRRRAHTRGTRSIISSYSCPQSLHLVSLPNACHQVKLFGPEPMHLFSTTTLSFHQGQVEAILETSVVVFG
ncbi:hypothetical protein PMIN04_008375 [Paraphaeosphaeria minitans]|uniref:Uncharacterized protein n=1 Tax=Paraphaeosphaeria minitans TaxID=565426 RepID=A0A9P6GES2_9PLEO|nr:hypothetical protein PMIN01_08677 [Paraphaeosphaeria minitans]